MKTHRLAAVALLVLATRLALPTYASAPNVPVEPLPSADASVLYVENAGQFDPAARYQAHAGKATLWIADDALWLTLARPDAQPAGASGLGAQAAAASSHAAGRSTGVNVRLSFVGAAAHPVLEPFGRAETQVSYFRGHDPAGWHAAVPVWSGVRYRDLYPGIDLELAGENGTWAPRLLARPGADLSRVRLRIEGAQVVGGDERALRLSTAAGEYRLPLLQVHGAEGAASQARLSGDEVLTPFARAGAEGPAIQSRQPLTGSHDLVYSTFLGGADDDAFPAIALDARGAVYLTAWTRSSSFPTTPGAFQETCGGGGYTGCEDAVVAKLSAGGSSLLYATFLGGSGSDGGIGIAVDGQGSAYVTGMALSPDFPVTPGAFITQSLGYWDAFVTKLDPSGTALAYSTYLGGNGPECPNVQGIPERVCGGVALDAQGNAYLAGTTGSSDFPTTPGAYDTTYNGGWDAYVAVLNASGSGLVYSTFLGGSEDDEGAALVRDAGGGVYVVGVTLSADFPATPGAFDTTFNSATWPPSGDAFVARLPADLSALEYATYLGGGDWECQDGACQIAVDASGSAYVASTTHSLDFPTTPATFQTTCQGGGYWYSPCLDAFVTKLDPSGAALIYSTYLGGSDADWGAGLALGPDGGAYVAGSTYSADFPTTPDGYDPSLQGESGAIITRLSADGTTLAYSTFFGGDSRTGAGVVLVDTAGALCFAGGTLSSDLPTTPGAYDRTYNGGYDLFVSKLAPHMRPQVYLPAAFLTHAP